MDEVDEFESEWETMKVIGGLAEECLVSKLEVVMEEVTDFEKIMLPSKITIEEGLNKIIHLLNSLDSSLNAEKILSIRYKTLLVPVIILVGEQNDSSKSWSSTSLTKSVALIASYIQNIINNGSDHDNVSVEKLTISLEESFMLDLQHVASPRKSLFFLCLQFLRSKLKRDTWKYYPAACTSFTWLLKQIKHPYLSDFVGDILSPSLLFADDYHEDSKFQGVACLDYAINELNKTDLLKENWGLVLYNAFVGMFHDRNPIIIKKIMTLLISVLKSIESDPNVSSHNFTKYDETMGKILFAMECCSERNLKLMWVQQLSLYLDVIGHSALHWHKRICETLLPFTSINDALLWKAIIKCMQACVRNTWLKPNSPANAEIVLRLALNSSVLDFPNISEDERLEVISLCKKTITLMSKCSDFFIVREQIDEMKTNAQFHPDFINVLKTF